MIRQFFKRSSQSVQQTSSVEIEAEVESLPLIKSLYFVHIPKTAGTSFRKALEAMQPMEKDYGPTATETSALIKQHMHDTVTPYELKEVMQTAPFALTGHVHIQKYADFFSARDIVTFVRDPIGQVDSHYNHFVAHNGFEGDFDKFYRSPQFRNVQSRYLNNFPLTLIGFVGLTEQYDESLRLINHGLGLELPALKRNVRENADAPKEALTSKVVEELTRLNSSDIKLYHQALELHQQRISLFSQGKEWVHIHASVNANNVLFGCAYFAESKEPVNLVVRINGEEQAMIVAKDFFGSFPKFTFPRQRYIGFHLPLDKWQEHGIDELELMVATTGQTYVVEPPLHR